MSSFGVKPRGRRRRRRDDAVELLRLPEPLQRVRQRPPLLDPRVDRDAGAQRGVLDRLEQRHRDLDLVAQRRVLAYWSGTTSR